MGSTYSLQHLGAFLITWKRQVASSSTTWNFSSLMKLIGSWHCFDLCPAWAQSTSFVLVLKSKLGVAPKYLRGHIRSPLSATSYSPLHSLDGQALFVPRVRTTMALTRSFASIGIFLWNALPSSLCVAVFYGSLPTSFSLLKTFFFSQVFLHWVLL